MNLEQLYSEIANGNEEAFDFIAQWNRHCHLVDDVIDGDLKDHQEVLKTFVQGQDLFVHPFFDKHRDRLYPVTILAANAYADSLELSLSDKESDKKLSDVLRSYGNEVLIIVAGICTPDGEDVWNRMRKYSRIIRQESWFKHHTKDNEPI